MLQELAPMEVSTAFEIDRAQLTAALAACRARQAVLLIAKLDRLARNVAFVCRLMEACGDPLHRHYFFRYINNILVCEGTAGRVHASCVAISPAVLGLAPPAILHAWRAVILPPR